MKSVIPFQATRYENVDLSKIICPPYDVLDEKLAASLAKQSPYNSVRLSYNLKHKPGQNRYEHVPLLIKSWKLKKVLTQDTKPAFYFLEEKFLWKGKSKTRMGIFALVPVLKNKHIVPHEKVFQDAVSDRLQLLKTTKSHISPIFLVYEDENKKFSTELKKISKLPTLVDASYIQDHIQYRFGRIDDSRTINKIEKILDKKYLLIADGHHRFATAKKYALQKGKESYILTFIAPSKNLVFSHHKVLSTILDSNRVTTAQILKTCKSGNLLPQKSTYFYPKVMTGFVFSSIGVL